MSQHCYETIWPVKQPHVSDQPVIWGKRLLAVCIVNLKILLLSNTFMTSHVLEAVGRQTLQERERLLAQLQPRPGKALKAFLIHLCGILSQEYVRVLLLILPYLKKFRKYSYNPKESMHKSNRTGIFIFSFWLDKCQLLDWQWHWLKSWCCHLLVQEQFFCTDK